MKKGELKGMLRNLQGLRSHKGAKFAVWTARNIEKLEREINILEEGIKPSKEYLEYEQKRAMLAIEHSHKDEAGNAKLVKVDEERSQYDIIDIKLFEESFQKLVKENSDIINERNKQVEEFNVMMLEESEIVLNKISFDLLPEEINGFETEGIISLIE